MANSTIFDDVFQTIKEKMPELTIPLLMKYLGRIMLQILLLYKEKMNIIQQMEK